MATPQFESDVRAIVRRMIEEGAFDERIRSIITSGGRVVSPLPRASVTHPTIPHNGLPNEVFGMDQPRLVRAQEWSIGVPNSWTPDEMFLEDRVTERDSAVILEARRELGGVYTSGCVNLGWGNTLKIGLGDFLQVVAKFPATQGMESRLLLAPAPSGDDPWVTLVRQIGQESHITEHAMTYHGETMHFTCTLNTAEWHRYGVWFREDGTHFFIDGDMMGSVPALDKGTQLGLVFQLTPGRTAGPPQFKTHSARAELASLKIWRPLP